MNIDTLKTYATPMRLSLATIGVLALIIAVTVIQSTCGKKHVINAEIAAGQADIYAKQLSDMKSQLSQKDQEIANRENAYKTLNAKYAAAKAKIPLAPLPTPIGETALAQALVVVGLGHATQVQGGIASTLNTTDATLVFNLDQQAKKAKAYEEALGACDGALKASEAVQRAQSDGLKLSGDALRVSQAEAQARLTQATELSKALKIEKQKGWRVWAYPAAAVVLTLVVKK